MFPKRKSLRRGAYLVGCLVAGAWVSFAYGTRGSELWSPGTLARGHVQGMECRTCHSESFRRFWELVGLEKPRLMNNACLSCHETTIGHDRLTANAAHGAAPLSGEPTRCSSCHLEHRGDVSPAVSDGPCLSCHAKGEKPIRSFPETHPEFRAKPERAVLRFDHRLHTRGDPRKAHPPLACGSCHRAAGTGPRQRGAYMDPIRYETHCARCHALAPPPRLEHRFAVVVTTDPQPCAKCHVLESRDGVPTVARAGPKPGARAERWYGEARFDHGRHTSNVDRGAPQGFDAECFVCHAAISTSTRASDVSLPGRSECAKCHTAGSGAALASCSTCHTFHRSGAREGASYGARPELAEAGFRETRFGLRRGTPFWPVAAFFELPRTIWKMPDLRPGTPEFEAEVFRRYGLFPADFPNDGLPLGLMKTNKTFAEQDGLIMTCEYCHSASVFGKVVVGQPNPFSDMETLFRDLGVATGERPTDPLYSKTPARNSVVNGADQMGLLGLVVRSPDLSLDLPILMAVRTNRAMELEPEFARLAYLKTPAWYLYAKKQTGAAGFYADGGQPKDGNFAAFTYLVTFGEFEGEDVRSALVDWQRSGHDFLATVKAPPYPFAIDAERAARGRAAYDEKCSQCHGTYDSPATAESLEYPGLVVPRAEVETDPLRSQMPESFVARTKTVLKERYLLSGGYVAPPLTGIWARAPYLHNGSVPTLRQLLDPTKRVPRYLLTANPNREADYDQAEVGWRFEPIPPGPPPADAKAYDPEQTPGLGNSGHAYGQDLSDEAKSELIEFLKTL
ncbi:MAG: cytochrome c3 family protein [Deltaproteobacteria bacterium]|nr:cytochrome c3 family protein [Deltaproteobacteria bacterium]